MKTWTRDQIDHLLDTRPVAVERGIVHLFNLQTNHEQSAQTTLLKNDVGFCAWAARSGTYYAKWILSGNHLSGKHLEKARKIAKHHSRQITEIANSGTKES
jgi:hypothetical protein